MNAKEKAHQHAARELGKKTHVNDQAYVEPMAVHLMNRWTYPLANRPIQSRCLGLIRSARLCGGTSSTDTRELSFCERGREALISLGGC